MASLLPCGAEWYNNWGSNIMIRAISLTFGAGCGAGLLFVLLCQVARFLGLQEAWHLYLPRELDWPWRAWSWWSMQIVNGGILGLLFLLPWLSRSFFWRGLIYSLIPSILLLLIYIPAALGRFGTSIPEENYWFYLTVDGLCGIFAALWLKKSMQG